MIFASKWFHRSSFIDVVNQSLQPHSRPFVPRQASCGRVVRKEYRRSCSDTRVQYPAQKVAAFLNLLSLWDDISVEQQAAAVILSAACQEKSRGWTIARDSW